MFYNTEGDLIGTTRYQDFDKLPKNALKTITSKYTFPEYALQECIAFTNEYNEISAALFIFDKCWTEMSENNQKVIWQYLKVLCVLCEKAKGLPSKQSIVQ